MAIPTFVAAGTLTAGVGAIAPSMPAGIVANDILLLQIKSGQVATPVTIANAGGGAWSAIGGFGGSHANSGVRGTWFWSRYDGVQTAPTTVDIGDNQCARITAYRGCVDTGSPINASEGDAPTFAEITSTLPSLTTTVVDCLVLDCIVGEGPDSSGTGVFGTWTNGTLTSQTERVDDSTATGVGGSLGLQTGGMASIGVTGTTTVVHASFRVAYKKIALAGLVATTQPGFSVDSSSPRRATINGQPFFPRIFYDSGENSNFADISVGNLDLGRFGMTHYLNYQFGPMPKVKSQLIPLASLGKYGMATGNAFSIFPIPDEGTSGFAVTDNDLISGVPFRTAWPLLPGAGGIYVADEVNVSVRDNVVQWYNTYSAAMPTMPLFLAFLPEGPLTPLPPGEVEHAAPNATQYTSVGYTEHLLSAANVYWWMQQTGSGGNAWMGEDPYPIFKPESTPNAQGGVLEQGGYPHFWVADRAAHVVAAAKLYNKVPVLVLQLFEGLFGGRFPTVPEQWQHVIMAITEGIRGLAWWQIGTNRGMLDQADGIRIPAENALIAISQYLATNEQAILSVPVTSRLTNSTSTGNTLTWRKGILPTIASAISLTSAGDGGRGSYQAELNALNDGVTQWSPMLDQSGNVRHRVFRKDGSTFLVFAYNYSPSPIANVTFTLDIPIHSISVVGESRTIAPNGPSFIDDFGGSSSLLQGSNRNAHIYELNISTHENKIRGWRP